MSYGMMNALMTPGLSQSERNVYSYIVGRANGARVCWPTVAEIMADLGQSRKTVLNCTKELVVRGLIVSKSRYKDSSHYFVVDVPGLHDQPRYSRLRNGSGPAEPSEHGAAEMSVSAVVNFAPEASSAVAEITPQGAVGCKIRFSPVQNLPPESVHKEEHQASATRAHCPARGTEDAHEGQQPRLPRPSAKASPKARAAHRQQREPEPEEILGFNVNIVVEAVCEIWGKDPRRADRETVCGWLSDGFESSHILRAVQRRVDRCGDPESIGSLKYFDGAVRERSPANGRSHNHSNGVYH